MSNAERDSPYRGMDRVDLDADAREHDAIAAFGRWRLAARSRILSIAGVAGAVLGALGYFAVQQYQHDAIGRAWIGLNVAGFAVPFAIAIALGLAAGHLHVRSRERRVVAELSERFDVDRDVLAETVARIARL